MDGTVSTEELFDKTIVRLKKIVIALDALLQSSPSDRIAMLAGAFLPQCKALLQTVENIRDRQSSRALARQLRMFAQATKISALPLDADSVALTFWLLAELNVEADTYAALEKTGKLGPSQAAVTEAAALFIAQSKRIALEAHRFADL